MPSAEVVTGQAVAISSLEPTWEVARAPLGLIEGVHYQRSIDDRERTHFHLMKEGRLYLRTLWEMFEANPDRGQIKDQDVRRNPGIYQERAMAWVRNEGGISETDKMDPVLLLAARSIGGLARQKGKIESFIANNSHHSIAVWYEAFTAAEERDVDKHSLAIQALRVQRRVTKMAKMETGERDLQVFTGVLTMAADKMTRLINAGRPPETWKGEFGRQALDEMQLELEKYQYNLNLRVMGELPPKTQGVVIAGLIGWLGGLKKRVSEMLEQAGQFMHDNSREAWRSVAIGGIGGLVYAAGRIMPFVHIGH